MSKYIRMYIKVENMYFRDPRLGGTITEHFPKSVRNFLRTHQPNTFFSAKPFAYTFADTPTSAAARAPLAIARGIILDMSRYALDASRND